MSWEDEARRIVKAEFVRRGVMYDGVYALAAAVNAGEVLVGNGGSSGLPCPGCHGRRA